MTCRAAGSLSPCCQLGCLLPATFRAGLLSPHAQVESDIGPYKGLLMGLFFMTGGHVAGGGRWPVSAVCCASSVTKRRTAVLMHPPPPQSQPDVGTTAAPPLVTCQPPRLSALPSSPVLSPHSSCSCCCSAVGMEISVPLLFAKIKTILAAMAMLIVGKVAVMAAVGQAFGLTLVQSARRCADQGAMHTHPPLQCLMPGSAACGHLHVLN